MYAHIYLRKYYVFSGKLRQILFLGGTSVKKIFISHSTKDEIGPSIVDYLESVGVKRNLIFCSSNGDTGVDATKKWFDSIFNEIRKSGTVIIVVTPNYMRSGISLLEAGAAIGARKKLIILTFPNVDIEELNNLFGVHQRIDFCAPNHRIYFKKCLEDNVIHKKTNEEQIFNDKYDAFINILKKHTIANSDIPPIAMRKENANIIKPCADYGIERLTLSQVDMSERIKKAHKIKIIATTGVGFFRTYNVNGYENNPLYCALKNGCEIEILLGNPSGPLFCDVESLEKRTDGSLNDEFSLVISELSSLVYRANGEGCGTIRVGNVDASLRQTVILIYGDSAWGWATVTLPPARCNAQSLSLELIDAGNASMLHKYENYFNAVWDKAADKNEIWDLKIGARECFRYEGSFALSKWAEKQKEAKDNMTRAEAMNNKRLLIECAAQHPLNPDGTPGEEFRARLDRSIKLYNEYCADGWSVNIYVPGSLHQIKNKQGAYVVDPLPLCESGKKYLINSGISEKDILAQEANAKYKGENGVYCSADECYVSSNLFMEGNYQRFMVVCSPVQAMRKMLYYILFSTMPIVFTESPRSHYTTTFHNYIYEAIKSIPDIIKSMDDMQENDCADAIKIRKERNPFY